MALLALERVWLEFPIHNVDSQSLRSRLVNLGTGGRLKREASRLVVATALEEVSLHLEHGDRIGLIGRNGAGKTTLLKVLAGVYEPTRGRVRREGRISALFDVSLGMDEDSTGWENVRRAGLLLGLSPAQIRAICPEVEAFSELGDYLEMPLRTYSAGMRMRLAFAVATSVEPEILLIDEVIGAGDAHFVEKAKRRTAELVQKSSIIVLASHSDAFIREFCNKALLLERGRTRAFGPVDDVLSEYAAATG